MIIRHFISSVLIFINKIVNAQQKINTPKLDKLTSEGMQFMQHYGGLRFVHHPDTL
jgi:hypothetical protein